MLFCAVIDGRRQRTLGPTMTDDVDRAVPEPRAHDLTGTATSAVVHAAGGGRPLRVMGNPWWVKVAGEQTGGRLAVVEADFAPGTGAPAHLHHDHDECFYILSGRFRFQAGADFREIGAGGFCYVPREVVHGFANISEQSARMMGVITPAGFERYFVEVAGLPPGPPDVAALREIFSRYDQELV